jgi:predicted phage terminase large subunit-like protein
MPPRHGKSITMRHALAWKIFDSPGCLNGYASYGQDLSDVTSLQTRRIVERLGVSLQRSKLRDFTTQYDGGLLTTSVGGAFTGRGINGGLLSLDDLLKGRLEAESKNEREKSWTWLLDDALSRAEGGSSVILTNTRWHEDDPPGRLKKDPLGLPWVHLNLPAISWEGKPVDERHSENFEPLWLGVDATNPTREGALAWYAKARARGEYGWWSLYQGEPRPRDSRVFGEPSYHELATPLDGHRVFIACDPAATANTKSDYSVAVAIAVTGAADDMRARVVDVIRGQWEIPELVKRLHAFRQKWHGAPVAVESVGGFKSVPQSLRSLDSRLRVVEITPRGDKYLRAQAAAAAWNNGRLTIPLGASWVPAFVDEFMEFSGGGDLHDDQVDALSHVWNLADTEMRSVARPRGTVRDARW